MITQKQVANAVCQIYKEAAIILPDDIKEALQNAYEREESDIAKLNIKSIIFCFLLIFLYRYLDSGKQV